MSCKISTVKAYLAGAKLLLPTLEPDLVDLLKRAIGGAEREIEEYWVGLSQSDL